jgi:ABC-2 type transport system permease protein
MGGFVTGKGLGAGGRAVSQAVFSFALALLLGVKLPWSVVGLVGTIRTVILGASFFSTLSMLIATIVKPHERFMRVGQVITMPRFFASNAIYPRAIMPGWLRVVAQINPLSYVVDWLRGYRVNGSVPDAALDWGILILATVIVQILAAQRYHTIVRLW